jgi:hypothetical protein
MPKFIKILWIAIIIISFRQVSAQEGFVPYQFSITLQKYEQINPVILNIVDNVLPLQSHCIFCVLDRSSVVLISIYNKNEDTILISAEICETRHLQYIEESRGYFYYRDNLIIIDFSGVEKELFCTPVTHDSITITATDKFGMHPYYIKAHEYANMRFSYFEGKLTKIGEKPCYDVAYIYEKISKFDTWESLAKNCHTTVENLHYLDGKYQDSFPEIGTGIYVKYQLLPNREIIIRRVSYKTVLKECNKIGKRIDGRNSRYVRVKKKKG